MTEIPEDILAAADVVAIELYTNPDGKSDELIIARAILAERKRCAGVANERAAQLSAVINSLSPDEQRIFGGQMLEALTIEQRIESGHQPKDAIDVKGIHS